MSSYWVMLSTCLGGFPDARKEGKRDLDEGFVCYIFHRTDISKNTKDAAAICFLGGTVCTVGMSC